MEDIKKLNDQINSLSTNIEEYKREIEDNQEIITELNDQSKSLSSKIEENKNKIEEDQEIITELNDQSKSLSSKIEENKNEIEDNQEIITDLSLHGQWCAYQDQWTSSSAVIRYDSSFFKDSNIKTDSLNVGTGETFIKYDMKHLIMLINLSASIKLKQY